MHFVILGSGRVGSSVAVTLDKMGHSVAVIDRESAALRKLPKSFSGQRVKGIGFDRDTMTKAGIEKAYAFAAVSNGDNTNILAARIARETFGVKRVVARIYDPRRAEAYERLGIPTVGTVRWSSGMILHKVLPDESQSVYSDPQLGVTLMRCQPHAAWYGKPIRLVEESTNARLAYINRFGKALLAQPALEVQENDELFLATLESDVDKIRHILSHEPVDESAEEI
ncbi:MAG: TrkA family potassium uptake protein [Actinomycetaceae bacterium]|nr:TrkA family potassium uptake protein [Actinomycetaceae bacterium]